MSGGPPDPSSRTNTEGPLIRIGQVVGFFGLRGDIKVQPCTDFPSRFEPGERVLIAENWHLIQSCRWHQGRPILHLEGIDSLDQAEPLKWAYLDADDSQPVLEPDEYRTRDLIGLRVVTADGEELGTVDAVERFPAQDVLVVGEILIPAVKAFVKSLDLDSRTIVVELLPGMRDG